MLLTQTTHKRGLVAPQLAKCLENNNWIIFLILNSNYTFIASSFFILCTPVPAKTCLKCWVLLGELQKFILLFVNGMWLTLCPFLSFIVSMTSVCLGIRLAHWIISKRHSAWSAHSVHATKLHMEDLCLSTLFPFWYSTAPNISCTSFSLGEHWTTPCHMVILPNSRLCLGADPSSLWVSVCFCERC